MEKQTLKYIHEVFTDVDERGSFKRLVTFLSFLVLVSMYAASTFFDLKVGDTILQVFQTITVAGCAAIATERFGKSFKDTNVNNGN